MVVVAALVMLYDKVLRLIAWSLLLLHAPLRLLTASRLPRPLYIRTNCLRANAESNGLLP